jgi:hypothetical protein
MIGEKLSAYFNVQVSWVFFLQVPPLLPVIKIPFLLCLLNMLFSCILLQFFRENSHNITSVKAREGTIDSAAESSKNIKKRTNSIDIFSLISCKSCYLQHIAFFKNKPSNRHEDSRKNKGKPHHIAKWKIWPHIHSIKSRYYCGY